jgi:ABC-type cobalamin/Fe3+-siderophores transport system ATPase subunit
MISNFKLKFGRVNGSLGESINTTPVTVFVGPNNSGKSKLLTEIEEYSRTGNSAAAKVILEELSFENISDAEINLEIDKIKQSPNIGETRQEGHIFVGGKYGRRHINEENLKNVLRNPAANIPAFCQWFLTHNTLLLNGQSRMTLVNQQSMGDLLNSPQSSLQTLFVDDEKRSEVRRIIFEAFDKYFVIDPTYGGTLRIRLSDDAPSDVSKEQSLDKNAREFHSKAKLIDIASDGVKAFTGIVSEVIAGDPQIILIDEPEAFLHPSLANMLGKELSIAANNADKRIFVSTHSPNFVMGCIQSGAPVNIIRLTYREGAATARLLNSDSILELMRNPLLRSTGLLSGMFYEFVVVTEADSDRAFYQEINERLLKFKPEWGIPNCLFLNAQNKQTIPTILRPLRQLGIPAVAIVDIDVLKDGGEVWKNLLSSINLPDIFQNSLAVQRTAIKAAMDATDKNMKKDGGISILTGSEKEAAMNLLCNLNEYGAFTVPGGELESWLPETQVSGHGPKWLIEVFEKMGSIYDDPNYIKPTDLDVWRFMFDIKKWLVNPNRKGIPS